jgi:hypothetical protein
VQTGGERCSSHLPEKIDNANLASWNHACRAQQQKQNENEKD